MSFASQAREEIARRSLQKDCCVRAAAYGIACFAKYFDASGLVLQTEQELTTQVASQLFARCGVQGDIIEKQRPSGVVYEFSIRAPEQVARMHELFGTTGTETSLQIDPRLIRCQTCVSAYIGAAFLCSGTVTDPQKEYNIEFLTSRTNLARDFEALLAEHEFAPHRTRRNGVNLVYVKSCDNVERILSFMGAAEASAQLSAQKAVKQMRNQINRHTNCDTANLGKTARANAQTLKAIRFLEEQEVRTPERLTEKIQELDTQLKEVSQRLNQQLSALRSVNSNLYAMKEYFETRPVYLELKNKYFGREKFKEEHKKELSGYYRSERILKENLDANGKIPEGKWKREADRLSEEIAALRKEDKRIHAMLRKYEKVKNHVEVLMAEEDEEVSLPETNKREQSTETKEAVRTMKRKKKHHGMEL